MVFCTIFLLRIYFKVILETKFRQTEKELKLNFPSRQLVAPWKERNAANTLCRSFRLCSGQGFWKRVEGIHSLFSGGQEAACICT